MNWAVASGAPSWAAAADQGPTMVSFSGPSSFSSAPTAEINIQDFSLGLAGRRARPAGTGRRSRAAGGGVPEACSVDGCRSDLSRCREYHRRHKVCEAHSKTPVVVVGGREQRFCQQCSRFHMLSEFDEGKRSCRKRLDGHNKRRRKPQHDLMNLGGFLPYHQGTFKTPKQFPFSHDGGSMLNAFRPNTFVDELERHTRSSSLSGTLGPECALSLLSSSRPSSITGQAQQTSSSLAWQDATTPSTVAYSSGAAHHSLVADALFEDPSQVLPFVWQ